jgi:UDP-N-acetylmuramate--alanine ligase
MTTSSIPEFSALRKVHFVGVGGIGVSAILRLFAARGIAVSGSDLHAPAVDRLPAGSYFAGHDSAHVPHDADLIVYSPAAGEANPERVAGKSLGIPELSYPQALAFVTKQHNTIAISGTHGKSTTTALAGKLFEAGGLDPSVVVGAEVPGWKDYNLRQGKSDLFLVEACEYRRNMLNLTPQTIVLTNIELDHPDYYTDLADVKDAFREYVGKLAGEDLLIVNNDDANIRDVIRETDAIVLRYGVGDGADLSTRDVRQTEDGQTFDLVWHGTLLGTFSTLLPGTYNIYNILAAVSAYLAYGGKSEAIQSVLDVFAGVGRRFEVVGTIGHATVISDYAHHPTALAAVVEAARARYKDKRLLVVFRPHHRERTIKLFDRFVAVVATIPHLILIEIYDVAGREEGVTISSNDVIEKVRGEHPENDLVYAADLEEAEAIIRREIDHFDVVLVIGAGDADVLARELTKEDRTEDARIAEQVDHLNELSGTSSLS